ncbi:hypothetical protein SOVF_056860, partial [Spinacia oleracea]
MGSNVFGTPITNHTLRAMPEYSDKKSITANDRSILALEMKNAEGKDINARNFLESLQARFGENVSTMCMIYNATGGSLTFVDAHNWTGRVCESPYPMVILNGQWGVFLHGRYGHEEAGSEAAVVYHGINYDWLLSFSNRADITNNRVALKIYQSGKFQSTNWNTIKGSLDEGKLMHQGTRGQSF